jgi:hypothetical protein
MNLVGKIFTMLILVMSLLFMAFAVAVYHTHRNWRDLAKDRQTEVMKYRDENAQLRDERLQMENRLAHERAARRAALARLETQVQEKQQQFEKRNQEYSDLLAQQRQAIDAMQNAQRQLDQLKEQIQVLQQEILVAQQDRDQQFDRVRQLTDQIHQAQGIQERLEQRLQELAQDYTRATTVLKAYDLTADSPVDNIPPQVLGQVLAVGPEMIEISIGGDDGIKPGHNVVVSRRDKFLGRAEITKVAPDRAVGRIKQRNAPFQEGDRVQTKVEIR